MYLPGIIRNHGDQKVYYRIFMIQRIVFIIFLSRILLAASADDHLNPLKSPVISGHIRDAKSGESLIGVNIYIKELGVGTVTNVYGFYSLSIPKGKYVIGFSYVGYVSLEKELDLLKDTVLNIDLDENIQQLEELVIKAEKTNSNITSLVIF